MLLALASLALAAPPEIQFEHYELDNGLDVILAPDHSSPIVHTQLWYHVGSRNEGPGLTGFAHLFEHLMFQGSEHAPGDYFGPIQEVGGTLNGTTNTDRTNYFETMPAEYLPRALFMESDRMGWMVVSQDLLDEQRDVVRNERRQRVEIPPFGDSFILLAENLWPEGHPYHHPTIGSHEDLEGASLDAVRSFFDTWYGPNNASLVVAGDFDTEQAKALVQQYFGDIDVRPVPDTAIPPLPELSETKVVRVQGAVPESRLWLTWTTPAMYEPGDAELDLVSGTLSGKDGRLYQALVVENGLARSVNAYQASSYLGSSYVIQATPAEGHTTDELVTAIDAVLADVLTGDAPPTQEELDASTASYEVGAYRRLTTISGRAGLLSSYLFYTGDPDYLAQDLARYREATPESVRLAGQKWLMRPRVELHYTPEEGQ